MDDFRVAASVFWLSFTANQRGCPPDLRHALLMQLVSQSESKSPFYQKKEFEDVFDGLYFAVMHLWVINLESLVKAWLNTDAGGHVIKECERIR